MSANSSVIYDGFNFADYGIILTNIDHLTVAPRRNQLETLANRNGAKLVQSQFGVKPITIEGYYIGDTPEDAQDMYDTIVAALNRQERPLIVPHAGSTRTYTATPENQILKQPDGLNRLTFSIEFVVPDGYSDGETDEVLVDQTITSASTTIAMTIDGSVKARPLITLNYNSLTGGTAKTMSIRNAADFIGLTFSRTFVAGDEIIIDSGNFLLYINGVLTEPDGRFPTWDSGTGSLYYSDSLTTRSVDITVTNPPKNL